MMGTWDAISKSFPERFVSGNTHNDDDGNGVKVGENVVGNTAELHGGAHLSQVGVHLTVCKPEDGYPEEDGAGSETTSNFVNPGVIEVVPLGRGRTQNGRLDSGPHVTVVPVLVCLDRVEAETASKSLEQELESRAHDVTARGTEDVELLAEDKDGKSNDEHDGRDQVCEPETDVALSVDHADLTDKSTNVDEEVEPVVNAGNSDGGVDNDTLSAAGLNAHLLLGNLLGDKRGDVGLESSSAETHDDESENENTKGGVRVGQHGWRSGGDENQVTNFSDQDRVQNSLEATEIGVGNPGSEKRADVDPEGVEGGQAESDLFTHVEGTRLSLFIVGVEGGSAGSGEGLGDEVGVYSNGSVVTHTLNQLNESNLKFKSVCVPRALSIAIAYGENLPWDPGRHATKRGKLLISGEVVSFVEVAVLERGLALGVEVGWRSSRVKLGVLARGVARGVNKSGVQANGLLG
jgi:hypothetical protein